MKTKKYSVKEIQPKIFLVNFEQRYDLCMTFLRYQEFYESPNSKFRNKNFLLFEFMDWYSKIYGKKNYGKAIFSYPSDWSGFNIPSKVISKLFSMKIKDWNIYDDQMRKIFDHCKKKSKNKDFYLIGATGDEITIDHEIAHGKFGLDKNYKNIMLELINKLPNEVREKLNFILEDLGYDQSVFDDEIQAYLSTGLIEDMSFAEKYRQEFINVYKKYSNNLKSLE